MVYCFSVYSNHLFYILKYGHFLRNEYNKFCDSLDQSKLRLNNEDRSCDSLLDQSKLSVEEEEFNCDPMASFSKRGSGDGQVESTVSIDLTRQG